jgi:hypothetical protein
MYVPEKSTGSRVQMRTAIYRFPWPENPEPSKCGAEPDHNQNPRPDVDEDVLGSRLNEVRYQRAADKTYGETLQDNQPSSDPHRWGWIPIHATPRLPERYWPGEMYDANSDRRHATMLGAAGHPSMEP